jgi:hypothetical protein
MWFDDTYLPESKAFTESFSPEELAALAGFDKYYDDQSKLLPDGASVTDWLRNKPGNRSCNVQVKC